jgi:hypothetical protein
MLFMGLAKPKKTLRIFQRFPDLSHTMRNAVTAFLTGQQVGTDTVKWH